jgi:hypothetical protein
MGSKSRREVERIGDALVRVILVGFMLVAQP